MEHLEKLESKPKGQNIMSKMIDSLEHKMKSLPMTPSIILKMIETIDGSKLASERKDRLLSVLASSEKGGEAFECLKKSGFGYKTVVLPKETLTHPSNRGGSLLNVTDVWQKGMRMVGIGIQPSLLQDCGVAFELPTTKAIRDNQVKANELLVAASNGALASLSGQERFLTVATSHTAAFCKAVEQGCKSAGGLTVDMKADDGLCKLITEGWTMFVISEMVEQSIPSLPAWLQMAMNSVNMGFKQVNEIEAASLMAELMKHGKSLKDALAQVEKSDPL